MREYFTYDFYEWEFEYPQTLECYYILSADVYNRVVNGEKFLLFNAKIRKTEPKRITLSSSSATKDTIDGFKYEYYSPGLIKYLWDGVTHIYDLLDNSSSNYEVIHKQTFSNYNVSDQDKKNYVAADISEVKNRLYKNFRISGKTFYLDDLRKFQIWNNVSIFDEKTGITYYCTNSILDYLFDNNLFEIVRVEGRKVIIKNFEQTIPLGFTSSYTFTGRF